MSSPIEDYALLGDGETAALLHRDGSINRLCWPRFDDDACFAALLGTEENGHWSMAPAEPVTRRSRQYQDDTLIMEMDLETAGGAVQLIDFMPVRKGASSLVRIVIGVRGTVRIRCQMRLRFDYGALPPWSEASGDDMVAKVGPDIVVLRAPVKLEVQTHGTSAHFDVTAGERLALVLSYGVANETAPEPIDAEAILVETQKFWREWIGRFDDGKIDWPVPIRRSLITLKGMIHSPTGGLAAAPTTSLPEAPGGKMNWDYRYCWLRDGLGTFTQYFGGQAIEAGLLLLPLLRFLPADDPCMTATIETIQRELSVTGLIRRTKAKAEPPDEGAFLACSCWMVDCLNLQGRKQEACAQFERVLAVANDLGLLSEEYNVPGQHLAGNFPQALTHLAVVNTALGLCGPTLQRGGG